MRVAERTGERAFERSNKPPAPLAPVRDALPTVVTDVNYGRGENRPGCRRLMN